MGYKNIHVKCERSEPEKIEIELSQANSYNLMRAKRAKKSKNWSVPSKASGKFLKNFALFPPILASLGQIIYFLSRKGQIIYFQYFKGQKIYFQKVPAPPPPPQNQMVVPLNVFKQIY